MHSRKNGAPGAKIAYGAGGLVCAAGITLLPLLLPLSTASGLNKIALTLACGLGVAFSVFLMPLFYALISGNTSITTGRYHVPLIVSGLLVSLCAVGVPCVGRVHPALQALILGGLFFVLALSMQTFAYAYFSIGKRFVSSGSAFAYSKLFAYLSPVLVALSAVWLFDLDRVNIRGIVCIASLCALVGLVCAYMATSSHMALFLRVETQRRAFAENYKRFIAPLGDKRVRLRFTSSVFAIAGVSLAVCAFPQIVFASRLGYTRGLKPTVLLIAAFSALMGILASFSRRAKQKAEHTSLVFCVLAVVTTGIMVVLRFFAGNKTLDTVTAYVYAVTLGLAIGTTLPCIGRQSGIVAKETGLGTGRTFALMNCAAALGLAVGTALSALVAFWGEKGNVAAAVASMIAFALLLLTGTLLRFVIQKRAAADAEKESE